MRYPRATAALTLAAGLHYSACAHRAPASDFDPSTWQITGHGVGPLRVGGPLPRSLPDTVQARYVTRYVADGQPWEGFAMGKPRVEVAMANGPFAAWDAAGNTGPPPFKRLERAAIEQAWSGARIQSLTVLDPSVRTEAGVGVGSTLRDIEAHHRGVDHWHVPPTRGDDQCVAIAKDLPDVAFYFADCDAAEGGERIVRIDLWKHK